VIEDIDRNEYDAVQIPLRHVHRCRDVKDLLANKEIQDGLFVIRVERLQDVLLHEIDDDEVIPPNAGNKFILAFCLLYGIK
jgi:hypothetical protein